MRTDRIHSGFSVRPCRGHRLIASGHAAIGWLLASLLASGVFAQVPGPPPGGSPDGVWTAVEEVEFPEGFHPPAHYAAMTLNRNLLEDLLANAPRETFGPIPPDAEIFVPMPDGFFGLLPAAETRLMEPLLTGMFPEIRSYILRLEGGAFGGHLALGPERIRFAGRLGNEMLLIEPVATDQGLVYLSFLERDRADDDDGHVHPPIGDPPDDPPPPVPRLADFEPLGAGGITTGDQLRIYRLAATTTAEFYQARGGSDANVLFSLVADLVGANAEFEPEVGVRLILSDATWDLLYSDPDTAPFDGAPPRCSVSEEECTDDDDCPNGETCDVRTPCQLRNDNRDNHIALDTAGIVEDDDYDVGVLFGVSYPGARGGCAWFAVCLTDNNSLHKARTAVTARGGGTNSTSGVLAHELGHQFGARHTFTGQDGSCTINEFLAGDSESGYEPGSGTTRMSYSGSCASDNVDVDTSGGALPAGSYLHSRSFDEIAGNVFGGDGATCGQLVNTSNQPPEVDAGPDYTIPRQTPFTLTPASYSDDQPLMFNWEQYDRAIIPRPIDTDVVFFFGVPDYGPIIRSVPPTSDPTRTVPHLPDLLDGTSQPPLSINRPGEMLPQVDRELNFRFIARDYQVGGGGVAYDAMNITVEGDPFYITSPNSGPFQAACEVPLTWQVGGGDVADFVDVLYSDDGGETFATVLESAIANDGMHDITMPCAVSGGARIKLAAVDNIFFDITDDNLTVFNLPPEVEVTADSGAVDEDCEFLVEFSSTVTHNCSVDADDVEVAFFQAQPNFTLGTPEVQIQQISDTQVDVQGSVLVSDLLDSPAQLAVQVSAEDACGEVTSEFAEAVIVDDTPPEIDVVLDPTLLWPPNHKMVPITAEVEVTDNCGIADFVLAGIESNEPDNGTGDGDTPDDIQDAKFGTADTEFLLRAERSGRGKGRIYTVTYSAIDSSDNQTDDSAEVVVPHSQ